MRSVLRFLPYFLIGFSYGWVFISLYILNVVVQSLSRVRFFATSWTAARQASLSITNSQSSLKLTYIEFTPLQAVMNMLDLQTIVKDDIGDT